MSLTELGIRNFFLFPEAFSTTAAYFVHVVETPSVAFENFFSFLKVSQDWQLVRTVSAVR